MQIDRSCLAQMQEILSKSAGYQVNIEEELEFFDPKNSTGWLLARNNQSRIVAFIRHFKQDLNWSRAEFYVDRSLQNRKALAQSLLTEFKKKILFPVGHRLRFEVLKSDPEMNDVIELFGFSQKRQLFLHFEMACDNFIQIEHQKSSSMNVQGIVDVLQCLHPVTELEVQRWIANGQIRTMATDSRVVAAAQINIGTDSIEIVRIATRPQALRQGHATQLIQELCLEAQHKSKRSICLKVESIREPAIALYKKLGFIQVDNQSQLWHSSWF